MTDGLGLGMEADASAKIVLALGSVREEVRRQRIEQAEDRKQRALGAIKNYIPLSASIQLDANGVGTFDLGVPTLGRVWTVRQLMAAVNGGEFNASTAANIGWYIGSNVNRSITSSVAFTSQWRASFTAVPAINTYTSDILQARFGEHLFVIVSGPVGLANAVIVVTAIVLDEPMKVGTPTSIS